MTTAFDRVATSRSVTQMGLVMHAKLLEAGWTLEFADADAINGGSATSPGWLTNNGSNSDAGRVIYKMPLNGFTTPWYVQIMLHRGIGSNNCGIVLTSGKGVNAGVLVSPGTPCGFLMQGTSYDNTQTESIICASANGFALSVGLATPYGLVVCAERRRVLSGDWTDDLVIHGMAPNIPNIGLDPNGSCIARVAATGESGMRSYMGIGLFNGNGLLYPNSLAAPGGLRGLAVGPLLCSGGVGGMSGHFVFFAAGDVGVGNDQTTAIAAGESLFFAISSNIFQGSTGASFKPAFLKA